MAELTVYGTNGSGGVSDSFLSDFNDFVGGAGSYTRTPAGSTSPPVSTTSSNPLSFLSDVGEAFQSGLGVVGQGFADYLNFNRAVEQTKAGQVAATTAAKTATTNDKMLLYAIIGLGAVGAVMMLRK